ncbi:MAG: ATP-binding protein [Deltaproteobacteria bacterium]|nr:ATP-binding protein [Deltaproteobacteria bacterium]
MRAAHRAERSERTLLVGRIFAAALLPTMGYFIFQDIVLLGVGDGWLWRLTAIVPALAFLLLSLGPLKRRPDWVAPVHALTLAGAVVNICGLTFHLFAQEGVPLEHRYGAVTGIVLSQGATFVFAAGARRFLAPVLLLPLAALLIGLLALGALDRESLTLFSNPVVMAGALVASAWVFERMSLREFEARRLAERRHTDLARTLGRLSHSNEELSLLANALAHDLRQPLQSITLLIEVLERRLAGRGTGKPADEIVKDLGEIADGMADRISNVLEYARLDTRMPPRIDVDLGAVVEHVRRDLQAALERSGTILQVGTLPVVAGDASQLEMLFQNLIENAIKYARPGRAPTIRIHAEPLGDLVRIWVEDEGLGVTEAEARRIFEPFERLKRGETKPGLGLGLAACKKIVRRHGGEIGAEPGREAGSRFFFTLPVRGLTPLPDLSDE